MTRRNRHGTGRNFDHDIILSVWCLVLVAFTFGVILIIAQAQAGLPDNRFGDRQWAGWCEGRDDLGWSFYCDPEEERRRAEEAARMREAPSEPPETRVPEAPAPETPAEPSAVARMDAMRAHLDELRAAAILEPTQENVEAYMREQARFMDMANAFSDRFRRVLWSTPDLDYEGVRPQRNLAKKATQADLFKTRQATMAGLNQRYGLIYVGTARCPVCRIYGPHLRRFAGDWQLTVLAVSADGSALTGWPEAVPDRGQLAKMQVTERIVPLTALFDKQTRRVRLLGVGFLSDEELIYRIHTLTADGSTDVNPDTGNPMEVDDVS